jgi:single-strand DNA-binding protein
MSNHVMISGNLGNDPELRFTSGGKAVVNGSIGDTPRRLNRETQQWEDAGETLWLRFSLWNNAEAFTEAARKGSKVVAVGRLKSRSWEKDGQKHTVTELDADSVAIVPKSSAGTSNWQQQAPQQGGFGGQQQADPWTTGGGAKSSPEPAWGSQSNQPSEMPF